jgi:hypothetical protein
LRSYAAYTQKENGIFSIESIKLKI